MKKFLIFLIIAVICVGGVIWWLFSGKSNENNNSNTNTQSNYQAEKSIANINTTNKNQNTSTNTANKIANGITDSKKEIEISNFATKIHNKDKERQNNIGITCKALTNKEIGPGEIFSFCDTVGKATTAKGYQKADIYVDGKKEQGLGGGNCQVSTTLYNAVLSVPKLEVIERHEHSGYVPYIGKGKDAAVSYGAYDFKFKNNTGNTIKIIMENTPESITAKIIEISK